MSDSVLEIAAAEARTVARQPEEVEIRLIRRDGGTQIRAAINPRKVDEYAEALDRGEQLPPIHLYYDGTDHWLDDGFHRIAAHEKAGRKTILAFVDPGTRRDAIFAAAGANGKHGLDRTDEDKKRAVWTLLQDTEWYGMTNRAIAEHVHVSPTFVGNQRAHYDTVHGAQSPAKRTDKRGREIDTTHIGKSKKADSAPAAPTGSATSTPSAPTPPADKFVVGDWVRATSGHEGEIIRFNGRNIVVQMPNGARDYLVTQLAKAPRPTGPQLPPPAANHVFMRATLESLYDQHARYGGWVPQMAATMHEAPVLHQAELIACCRRRAPSGAPIRWWQITPVGCEVLGRPILDFAPEPPDDEYPAEPGSVLPTPPPAAPAPAESATPTPPASPALAVVATLTLQPPTDGQPRVATAVLKRGDDVGMRRIVFEDAATLGQAILDAENELPRR